MRAQLCLTLFDRMAYTAHQAPLDMEFSRQEYWSRLPFPTPGDLPDPGIEPASLASPTLAGGFFTTLPPGKPFIYLKTLKQVGSQRKTVNSGHQELLEQVWEGLLVGAGLPTEVVKMLWSQTVVAFAQL